MTPVDLDAIEARLAAPIDFEGCPDGPDRFEFWTNEAGAGLFTHAQQDITALVAEVERLRTVVKVAEYLAFDAFKGDLILYPDQARALTKPLRAALDALNAGGA